MNCWYLYFISDLSAFFLLCCLCVFFKKIAQSFVNIFKFLVIPAL